VKAAGAAIVGFGLFAGWRALSAVEGWFNSSGAGNLIMWALVACLVLLLLGLTGAILIGAYGVAARPWVVRLEQGQHIEATHRALLARPQPPALPAPGAIVIRKAPMRQSADRGVS
jgi:hypothetical protein